MPVLVVPLPVVLRREHHVAKRAWKIFHGKMHGLNMSVNATTMLCAVGACPAAPTT